MRARANAAALTTLTLAVACGTPSTSRSSAGTREVVVARKQLDEHRALCTKRYGYDPEVASELGANVLPPGEREWRECVYQGIEKYLLPKTFSPDAYRRAIAEDRKLTEAVARGEITRAQRQARIHQLLEEIEQAEEANRSNVEMDRLEMEIRQDMMRRSLGPLRR
jgi:hypothetical protein